MLCDCYVQEFRDVYKNGIQSYNKNAIVNIQENPVVENARKCIVKKVFKNLECLVRKMAKDNKISNSSMRRGSRKVRFFFAPTPSFVPYGSASENEVDPA